MGFNDYMFNNNGRDRFLSNVNKDEMRSKGYSTRKEAEAKAVELGLDKLVSKDN